MKPVSKPFKNPHNLLAGAQFADRYSLIVNGQALNATAAAERSVGRMPRWVAVLMVLRNLTVWPFRLKTGAHTALPPQGRIGIFPVVDWSTNRIVLGIDDRHLDFRLLVEVKELEMGRQEVTASTAVKTHNLLGRVYLAIVKPFHRIIVPAMLAQVAAE